MQRLFSLLVVFLIASAAGVTLVATRWVVTGRGAYLYLPWNLFLAWVPLGFALLTVRLLGAPPRRGPGRPDPVAAGAARLQWPGRRVLAVLVGLGWLLFLPNAPYILTDLIHLAQPRSGVGAPLWFDLLVHLLFALTGLLIGYASLALVQDAVTRLHGRLAGWGFASLALALAAFGIYIGRFLRWNSWDILRSPLSLLGDVAQRLVDPLRHPRTYGFTVVCFLLLWLGYLMCHGLVSLGRSTAGGDDDHRRERTAL